MTSTAMIQVLGAVAYGELKAYEGAKEEAAQATGPERLRWRKVAAEELRHHKGFVARLEALGADPDRAMRPFRESLDRFHARPNEHGIEDAIAAYLGGGVADDLLRWLREVVDDDTAAFIDTVIEDEVEHEANAAADLTALLAEPGARARAAAGARRMIGDMAWSGRGRAGLPLAAFLRVGKTPLLLAALVGGHARRMRAIGLAPLGLPIPAPA